LSRVSRQVDQVQETLNRDNGWPAIPCPTGLGHPSRDSRAPLHPAQANRVLDRTGSTSKPQRAT
jgi:hypothetical protein